MLPEFLNSLHIVRVDCFHEVAQIQKAGFKLVPMARHDIVLVRLKEHAFTERHMR